MFMSTGLFESWVKARFEMGPILVSWRPIDVCSWECELWTWNPTLPMEAGQLVPLSVGSGTEQFEHSNL